jgi:predicted DNA binding CopG/RHH family protein
MERHETDPIPKEFESLEDAGEFWDTHSAADYWDDMVDVALEVEIRDRRFVVLLEDSVYHAIEELAATRGIQPDTLVNEFLRQELARA